jgi:hypothetical protein
MSGTEVPTLVNFTPGQGVIPAAWLNTVVQGGCYLANLRSFAGLLNQTVQMIGFTAQGDGGQGTFVWSGNPGTDDGGVSCIVPYGNTSGCWLRQVPGYVMTNSSAFLTSLTNIAALRAATTTTLPGSLVYVEGYFVGADGGEGMFYANASDTSSTDNGGTIIVDASGRRWYREAAAAVKNIKWFGANPTVADCTSAYLAALASLSGSGGAIYFPHGVYTFLSSASFTYPSGQFAVTVFGDGQDATILQWITTSGLAFVASSPVHTINIHDMTLSTAGAGGSSTGLSLTNSIQGGNFGQNNLTRLTLRGSDGGAAANFWNTGISIIGWGNFAHEACVFYGPNGAGSGIGIAVAGQTTGAFKYSLIHNFTACSWFTLAEGINYGTYVQGVSVSQCNFTNGTTDIYLPAGAVGCVQLTVVGSQFAGSGTRILLNGALAAMNLADNLIFVAGSQIGVAINGTYGQFSITGNTFSGMSNNANFGIVVATTGYTCVVTGNVFYGLANGISLQGATTGGWIVALNNYAGTTNTVIDIGSNQVGVITQ